MNGYYQGWDLHPAQLPTRYAAVYAFFLSARPAATARLRNFVEKAAQATLVGDVFDDAATGQGLLNFFVAGTELRRAHARRSTRDRPDPRRTAGTVVPEDPRGAPGTLMADVEARELLERMAVRTSPVILDVRSVRGVCRWPRSRFDQHSVLGRPLAHE